MIEALGHYKILELIGVGGLGEVYRARDTRHGRTVAIKLVPDAIARDPAARARLLHDARATAGLSHPAVATLYEIGDDQDHLFLAFDFVPGQTLTSIIAGRPLNPRRAIDLAVQIADGLAEGHAAGIVHGDVNPANVIVTPKGNAKVLDFGLAEWTGSGRERRRAAAMTEGQGGPSAGAAFYLSPEQALGEPGDERTDIFSLGVILFEMLTGKPPFGGATASAVAMQIVQATAPPVSAVNSALPPELDTVVARALAKSFDQRYGSAATMAAELRSVAAVLEVRSDAAERDPDTVIVRPQSGSGGRWIAVVLTLALLAAAAWFVYGR